MEQALVGHAPRARAGCGVALGEGEQEPTLQDLPMTMPLELVTTGRMSPSFDGSDFASAVLPEVVAPVLPCSSRLRQLSSYLLRIAQHTVERRYQCLGDDGIGFVLVGSGET